jgi:hypothetical protein
MEKNSSLLPDWKGAKSGHGRIVGLTWESDARLGWVEHEHPHLETWRKLAETLLQGESTAISMRLAAMTAFLEKFIERQRLPVEPRAFFSGASNIPDFFETACSKSRHGIRYNNSVA